MSPSRFQSRNTRYSFNLPYSRTLFKNNANAAKTGPAKEPESAIDRLVATTHVDMDSGNYSSEPAQQNALAADEQTEHRAEPSTKSEQCHNQILKQPKANSQQLPTRSDHPTFLPAGYSSGWLAYSSIPSPSSGVTPASGPTNAQSVSPYVHPWPQYGQYVHKPRPVHPWHTRSTTPQHQPGQRDARPPSKYHNSNRPSLALAGLPNQLILQGRPIHYQAKRFVSALPQPRGPTEPRNERSPSPHTQSVPQLPVPEPTAAYLEQANKPWTKLSTPKKLLVIIDLNGTLVHRPRRGGHRIIPRPRVDEFLAYLIKEHHVMIWSSARPGNVNAMVAKIVKGNGMKQLAAVWGRDTLRLSQEQYNVKVQVYKQLQWVWESKDIQAKYEPLPNTTDGSPADVILGWDQSNTFLIDDSVTKACSHPHNLVGIEEFTNAPGQKNVDVLAQIIGYIEEARYASDVSSFARQEPFRVNERWKWQWPVDVSDPGCKVDFQNAKYDYYSLPCTMFGRH